MYEKELSSLLCDDDFMQLSWWKPCFIMNCLECNKPNIFLNLFIYCYSLTAIIQPTRLSLVVAETKSGFGKNRMGNWVYFIWIRWINGGIKNSIGLDYCWLRKLRKSKGLVASTTHFNKFRRVQWFFSISFTRNSIILWKDKLILLLFGKILTYINESMSEMYIKIIWSFQIYPLINLSKPLVICSLWVLEATDILVLESDLRLYICIITSTIIICFFKSLPWERFRAKSLPREWFEIFSAFSLLISEFYGEI